jgi:Glyoxalase-like domain
VHDDVGGQEARVIVDHLVYATPDLAAGVERIAALLDVEAAAGGQHRRRGTRNALVCLGPRTYLEIVGPDPDQPSPAQPRWFGIDALKEPRLVTWAAAVADVAALASRAERAGVILGRVTNGQRTRPDGVELSWCFTDPETVVCDGIVPFLIDWRVSPHPSAAAPEGAALVALRAEHPDVAWVERSLRVLDLEMPITYGAVAALVATIQTPRGNVELR